MYYGVQKLQKVANQGEFRGTLVCELAIGKIKNISWCHAGVRSKILQVAPALASQRK